MTHNGTAQQMVHEQGLRTRRIIEDSDYSKCPVGGDGQKEKDLFLIDGMVAMLDQKRRRTKKYFVAGGGVTGIALIALDLFLRWKGLR